MEDCRLKKLVKNHTNFWNLRNNYQCRYRFKRQVSTWKLTSSVGTLEKTWYLTSGYNQGFDSTRLDLLTWLDSVLESTFSRLDSIEFSWLDLIADSTKLQKTNRFKILVKTSKNWKKFDDMEIQKLRPSLLQWNYSSLQ